MEGLQRELDADSSATAVSFRRMSFNPVEDWVPPESQKGAEGEEIDLLGPTTFTEVSKRKRIIQCATAVVYCLLSAGVVFGRKSLGDLESRD